MKNEAISIIMLTHNKLEYTQQCISALKKTTKNFELIIIDNASTDGTIDYLKELSKNDNIIVKFNKKNKGFASGCNMGVSMAKTKWICLLNNDTVPLPFWLANMKSAFTDRVEIVGAKLLFPDQTIQHCGVFFGQNLVPYHRLYRYPSEILEANILEEVPCITAAAMLTHKDIWNEVGGMDESFTIRNFEDIDFNLKVRERGYKVIYQPQAALIHFEQATHKLNEQAYNHNLELLITRWSNKLAAGLASV